MAACASADDQTVRPQKASSKDKDTDDDDDNAPATTATTITTSVPSAAPITTTDDRATTYVGTLDTTPTIPFGGDPWCNYEVALKDIRIEVAARADGQVIGARVTDTMAERSINGCPHEGAPPTACSFNFTTATQTTDGIRLAFTGAPTNHPATDLIVDLKKVGSSYEAAAAWKRTDQGPPLDWNITTKITLGPR